MVAEKTCASEQREHLRHEQRVVDGRGQLDVPKVTGTPEHVLTTCLADAILFHRPQGGVIEATGCGRVGVVQQDGIDNLLYRYSLDIVR